MREYYARTLGFAARMQKRRRDTLAQTNAPSAQDAPGETERLKEKAASLLAALERGSVAELEDAVGEQQVSGAEEIAAVSGRFEPALLAKALGLDDATQLTALGALAPLCSVETASGRVNWLLHSERRASSLRWLVNQQRLTTVCDGPLPPTDRLGEMLRHILKQQPIVLEQLSDEDLLAVSWSLEALTSIDVPKPAAREVHQRLARTRFLPGYGVLLAKEFIDRDNEQAKLAAFVRDPAPGLRLLLLSGPGGSGKSTLLAKFARDIAAAGAATVVVLDFDRPGFDGADTLWLEMEITRQVGAQHPEHEQSLRQAREEVRRTSADRRHAQQMFDSGSLEGARGTRHSVLLPVKEALDDAGRDQSLLLILDTFEEVVQRELTGGILEWLSDLDSLLSPISLRVILSGRIFDNLRSYVQGYKAEQIVIDQFPPETAGEFLRALGVPEPAAARLAASEALPRRPLELKLVAKLITDSSLSSIDELERELQEGGDAARDLFAGLVYRRVLLRISVPDNARGEPSSIITDELLRKLAYPGLVLRYVTPALVREVMVPALELPELDDTQAAKALDMLARYEWLVYRHQDEVWPRRDLRRSVLKPMLAENPARTKRIRELAVSFFETSPDERMRSEVFYHQLMALTPEHDGFDFDLDALHKAGSYFEADLPDLPPSGAALLRFATEGDVEVEKVRLLPRSFREPAYQAKGARLVDSREFAVALQLYSRSAKPLADWERTLLFRTGEWEELRSRLGDRLLSEATDSHAGILPGISGWRDLGEGLLSSAVTRTLAFSQIAKVELPKPSSEVFGSGFATTLQMLSVGLVMIADGAKLSDKTRNSLAEALPQFANLVGVAPVLEKRLIYLKLLSDPAALERLPISPSTITLSLKWLTEAPAFLSRCGEVPPAVLGRFNTMREFAVKGTGGQRDTRSFLSFVQNEGETLFVPLDRTKATPEALWSFLDGPNPEFRDPARFALLEAFADANSYVHLAHILQEVVPFPLDDLQPERFKERIAANPEHALEVYVELADRVGSLEALLQKAGTLVPDSRKLKAVRESLERWRLAARKTVLSTKLTK